MSNGSNSANLLLAAELLESYANRAASAEQGLRSAEARCLELEARVVALSDPDRIRLPKAIIQLAKFQFELLCSEFEQAGNVIGQTMCQASASTLARYVDSRLTSEMPQATRSNGKVQS